MNPLLSFIDLECDDAALSKADDTASERPRALEPNTENPGDVDSWFTGSSIWQHKKSKAL